MNSFPRFRRRQAIAPAAAGSEVIRESESGAGVMLRKRSPKVP